ncbi:MAG: hypothetical protein ABI444_04065 [Candidatus Kapaibacterium sp.]|jgi:hypothetical protein
MRRKLLLLAFLSLASFALPHTQGLLAQGMPIDSLMPRLFGQFPNKAQLLELRNDIPNYDNQRVWGLAIGDFSNDALPDLAISLYDIKGGKNQVTVYFFQNIIGEHFQKMLERIVPYVASPIEVGLVTEGSVVTIVQKSADQHWFQQGYSLEDGDVVLVDHFETEKEDIAGTKPRSIGHEVYRNYESLLTRETYFTGKTDEPIFNSKYYTFPSYRRLKNVYPGYGYGMIDTTQSFITEGLGFRSNSADLAIGQAVTSYDDDYIYFSISVRDDNIVTNMPKDEANDRVSLWFDTHMKGDRHILSKQGGFPTFRTLIDSTIYNVTFILPSAPGKVTRMLYSSGAPLSPSQEEAMKSLKAMYTPDSTDASQTGYTLRVRIPFAFLGFETNPVHTYERTGADPFVNETDTTVAPKTAALSNLEELPSIGFTAVVYDIDDASRPEEVTVQATSNFKPGDPSTMGTLILEPSTKFYGEVSPTYEATVKQGLTGAGF